jgi:hypothetical protein
MWGIPGLIMNSANLLLLKGNVTVEISTYLSAATLIWIGGMILFGVRAYHAGPLCRAAAVNAGSFNFKVSKRLPVSR